MMPPLFASDNTARVHPEILKALVACNSGKAPAYGADDYTGKLNALYSELFEHEAYVFPVPTGTAANGLALSAVTPPYGTILCHEHAHIVTTECGAPEFYSGGARLTLLEGVHSKLDSSQVERELAQMGDGSVHHLVPSALSLTQATERGIAYTIDEIRPLSEIAHSANMKVHMDGARFANALIALDVNPAEMSWRSGVDILSFGTTKNGTANAEAVIVFDGDLAHEIAYRHKRAGLLCSKMRYMSAQLIAYLKDDLWLENARKANSYAHRLSRAISAVPDAEIAHPTQINMVFAALPPALLEGFESADIRLRSWPDERGNLYRLVASFGEHEHLVKQFEASCLEVAKALSGQRGGIGTAEDLK